MFIIETNLNKYDLHNKWIQMGIDDTWPYNLLVETRWMHPIRPARRVDGITAAGANCERQPGRFLAVVVVVIVVVVIVVVVVW